MRVLVTGATGFAGSYLVERLLEQGETVFGLVRAGEPDGHAAGIQPLVGDLLEPATLHEAVKAARPDVIYHLAGQANVGRSWDIPAETMSINVNGTIHLLDAAIANDCPRVVAVTSGDIYGPQPPSAMPLTEETLPNAYHPYGVSKIAASEMLRLYQRRFPQIDIIEARPFNHIGPRQSLGFVVPDFASQIAEIKLGRRENQMRVGNLASERDFTDVRDVVRAYTMLAEHGRPGECYLICTGNPIAISGMLDQLIDIGQVEVDIQTDPDRMRPSDTPILYGSYAKLHDHVGWEPNYTLRESLEDVLNAWLERL